MIYCRIADLNRYRGISENLDAAFELIATTDFAARNTSVRYEGPGGIYYFIQDEALTDNENAEWECHRKYIDIQYAFEGGEEIDVTAADNLRWGAYNPEKDAARSNDRSEFSPLYLRGDSCAVLFPEDAHRACIRFGDAVRVRKAVIKVPVFGEEQG